MSTQQLAAATVRIQALLTKINAIHPHATGDRPALTSQLQLELGAIAEDVKPHLRTQLAAKREEIIEVLLPFHNGDRHHALFAANKTEKIRVLSQRIEAFGSPASHTLEDAQTAITVLSTVTA